MNCETCESRKTDLQTGDEYCKELGARKRNGGLSVDDNKWILLLGIVLILIGLAGIKF